MDITLSLIVYSMPKDHFTAANEVAYHQVREDKY